MSDQNWMDQLNHDPDLLPDKDEVDELIRSTREELLQDDAPAEAAPAQLQEKPPASKAPPKEVFQPKIPDIYADLALEEEEEEETMEPKKRMPVGLRVLIYVFSVAFASVLLAFVGWDLADDMLALTKPDREVTITVAETDTIQDITDKLADAKMIEHKWLFRFFCALANAEEKIDAGTYELNNYYDYNALVRGMRGNSNRITRSVTIPEGYSCEQIFEILEEKGVCRASELYDAAANYEFDYWFLENLGYGTDNRLEGYLFPDTYEFYSVRSEDDDDDPNWTWPDGAVGEDATRVLDKFLKNFRQKFSDELRASIETLNERLTVHYTAAGFSEEEIAAAMMNEHKIVIVASLIEKETASVTESATISSVIYNRLCSREYPLLEIDATVLYALGEHKEVLTAADLMIDSPYNTRKYPGLPIGPIANPGLDSIRAALNPEETNYYFYALDNDGTHHFSETYQEHAEFLDQLESAQ